MREAMSAHDLRGLSLIADLCILEGVLVFITGVLVLVSGFLIATIPIITGVSLIAVGHYLNDLRKFAWWAIVIMNSLILANILLGSIFTGIVIGLPFGLTNSVTFIINVVLSTLVIGYLLKSNVRNLFFQESTYTDSQMIEN
jgi:hypothetical protein